MNEGLESHESEKVETIDLSGVDADVIAIQKGLPDTARKGSARLDPLDHQPKSGHVERQDDGLVTSKQLEPLAQAGGPPGEATPPGRRSDSGKTKKKPKKATPGSAGGMAKGGPRGGGAAAAASSPSPSPGARRGTFSPAGTAPAAPGGAAAAAAAAAAGAGAAAAGAPTARRTTVTDPRNATWSHGPRARSPPGRKGNSLNAPQSFLPTRVQSATKRQERIHSFEFAVSRRQRVSLAVADRYLRNPLFAGGEERLVALGANGIAYTKSGGGKETKAKSTRSAPPTQRPRTAGGGGGGGGALSSSSSSPRPRTAGPLPEGGGGGGAGEWAAAAAGAAPAPAAAKGAGGAPRRRRRRQQQPPPPPGAMQPPGAATPADWARAFPLASPSAAAAAGLGPGLSLVGAPLPGERELRRGLVPPRLAFEEAARGSVVDARDLFSPLSALTPAHPAVAAFFSRTSPGGGGAGAARKHGGRATSPAQRLKADRARSAGASRPGGSPAAAAATRAAAAAAAAQRGLRQARLAQHPELYGPGAFGGGGGGGCPAVRRLRAAFARETRLAAEAAESTAPLSGRPRQGSEDQDGFAEEVSGERKGPTGKGPLRPQWDGTVTANTGFGEKGGPKRRVSVSRRNALLRHSRADPAFAASKAHAPGRDPSFVDAGGGAGGAGEDALARARRRRRQAADLARDLAAAGRGVCAADVVELGALPRPSTTVRLVAEALCVVFGLPDPSWRTAHALLLRRAYTLVGLMGALDAGALPADRRRRLRRYVAHPLLRQARAARASRAAGALCAWVQAVHNLAALRHGEEEGPESGVAALTPWASPDGGATDDEEGGPAGLQALRLLAGGSTPPSLVDGESPLGFHVVDTDAVSTSNQQEEKGEAEEDEKYHIEEDEWEESNYSDEELSKEGVGKSNQQNPGKDSHGYSEKGPAATSSNIKQGDGNKRLTSSVGFEVEVTTIGDEAGVPTVNMKGAGAVAAKKMKPPDPMDSLAYSLTPQTSAMDSSKNKKVKSRGVSFMLDDDEVVVPLKEEEEEEGGDAAAAAEASHASGGSSSHVRFVDNGAERPEAAQLSDSDKDSYEEEQPEVKAQAAAYIPTSQDDVSLEQAAGLETHNTAASGLGNMQEAGEPRNSQPAEQTDAAASFGGGGTPEGLEKDMSSHEEEEKTEHPLCEAGGEGESDGDREEEKSGYSSAEEKSQSDAEAEHDATSLKKEDTNDRSEKNNEAQKDESGYSSAEESSGEKENVTKEEEQSGYSSAENSGQGNAGAAENINTKPTTEQEESDGYSSGEEHASSQQEGDNPHDSASEYEEDFRHGNEEGGAPPRGGCPSEPTPEDPLGAAPPAGGGGGAGRPPAGPPSSSARRGAAATGAGEAAAGEGSGSSRRDGGEGDLVSPLSSHREEGRSHSHESEERDSLLELNRQLPTHTSSLDAMLESARQRSVTRSTEGKNRRESEASLLTFRRQSERLEGRRSGATLASRSRSRSASHSSREEDHANGGGGAQQRAGGGGGAGRRRPRAGEKGGRGGEGGGRRPRRKRAEGYRLVAAHALPHAMGRFWLAFLENKVSIILAVLDGMQGGYSHYVAAGKSELKAWLGFPEERKIDGEIWAKACQQICAHLQCYPLEHDCYSFVLEIQAPGGTRQILKLDSQVPKGLPEPRIHTALKPVFLAELEGARGGGAAAAAAGAGGRWRAAGALAVYPDPPAALRVMVVRRLGGGALALRLGLNELGYPPSTILNQLAPEELNQLCWRLLLNLNISDSLEVSMVLHTERNLEQSNQVKNSDNKSSMKTAHFEEIEELKQHLGTQKQAALTLSASGTSKRTVQRNLQATAKAGKFALENPTPQQTPKQGVAL